jgi:hypothetical protein
MKCLSPFVLLLPVLGFAMGVAGEGNSSATEIGTFITLKQRGGSEFRAFVAGAVSIFDENDRVLENYAFLTPGIPLQRHPSLTCVTS